MSVRQGLLHLAVRDDGIGGADPGRGSGLVGITDRVEALGGTMSLDSPAGGGTAVQLELPVHGTGRTRPGEPDPPVTER
jgi:signal transduction histidine kinase